METTQILLNQYSQLPENLQLEVLHFVEFLSSKFKVSSDDKDLENDLTEEQKRLLSSRFEVLKRKPEEGLNWRDAHTKLLNKYQ